VTYDRELLGVSAVLHDPGLTKIAPVEARFEIEGADLAKEFLAKKEMSERHVEIAWDAIALHTTVASNAVAEACERRVPGVQRPNLCDRLIDRSAHGVGTRKRTS
jgi:hypothetical protein